MRDIGRLTSLEPGKPDACLFMLGSSCRVDDLIYGLLRIGAAMRDVVRHGLGRQLGAMALAAAVSGCAVYAEPHPGYYYSTPAPIPPRHLPPPGEARKSVV